MTTANSKKTRKTSTAQRQTIASVRAELQATEERLRERDVELIMALSELEKANDRRERSLTEVTKLSRMLFEAEGKMAKADAEADKADAESERNRAELEKRFSAEQASLKKRLKNVEAPEKVMKKLNDSERKIGAQKKEISHLIQRLAEAEGTTSGNQSAFTKGQPRTPSWVLDIAKVFLTTAPGRSLGRLKFRKFARRIVDEGVIDAEWYLAHNSDVAESGIDPVMHFLRNGLAEGRAPRDWASDSAKIGAEADSGPQKTAVGK